MTHGVDKEKAQALDNLMEIDLGGWEVDALSDSKALERAVLSSAHRLWYRCSLYDDLNKVCQKRAELKAKIPAVLERRRLRAIEEQNAVREHQELRAAHRAPIYSS